MSTVAGTYLLTGPIGRTLLMYALPTLASSALLTGVLAIVLSLLALPGLTLFLAYASPSLPIAERIVKRMTRVGETTICASEAQSRRPATRAGRKHSPES